MIRRLGSNLGLFAGEAPPETADLERDGYAVVRDVFTVDEVVALTGEILALFDSTPPDRQRNDRAEFRYAMLNSGALSQATAGHPCILAVIEPLLGDDCHIIANTAWNNPPEFAGGPWHCDAALTGRGRRTYTTCRTRCRASPASTTASRSQRCGRGCMVNRPLTRVMWRPT